MERRRVTYGLFAMLLISALTIAAPVSAQPTADSFGVNDVCGTAGAVIGVPVIIENAQNGPINAVQFSITYNTSVITVSSVQQGALTSDWSLAFVNTVGDTTTVGLFVLSPSSAVQNGATGTVAIINFNVVGANGSSSGMNMSNIQLQNTSYQVGMAPAKNGVFWVGPLAVHNLNTSEDFAIIQEAIDDADTLDGHTILVDSGTYHERVNVTKRLIVRGNDTGGGKPVVDASSIGNAITLSHDSIVLDGFTAINAGSVSGAGIFVYSNNNVVINNTASNNYNGILLYNSSNNNTLTGNTANSNSNNGILLYNSSNNTLTDNIANSNNDIGILLYNSSNNTLTCNTANSNKYYGISLSSSNKNNITNNTFSNNSYDGILLDSSSNNTIMGNTASNNDIGILLYYFSNYNTLTGNIASNNNYNIYLSSSNNNNHIYNNYLNNANNAWDGGNNIWNVSKISGTNIIDGLWLGGNYWSDYAGSDTDGDGFGDTPYDIPGGTNKDYLPLIASAAPHIFDTSKGAFPSISGTFTGTITPSQNLTVSTLYTHSCPGTGGHTKSINLYENDALRASGVWSGYLGDWHNITFTQITLLKDHEYRYVIVTGSYPQIIHAESKDVTGGRITCEEFVDINGKRHVGWIPAIRLS